MIAVETNILAYSHKHGSPWFEQAFAAMRSLTEGTTPWAIPWPSIHEFMAVVTNPKIYTPASTIDEALAQVEEWMTSPTVTLIGERADHLSWLSNVARRAQLRGGMIHDAKIAAICLSHGVTELWTADRDFTRFPALKTRNPLIA